MNEAKVIRGMTEAIGFAKNAGEVQDWIESVIADDGEVGLIDVRAQVRKRWPDLPTKIQEQIADAAWQSAVADLNK